MLSLLLHVHTSYTWPTCVDPGQLKAGNYPGGKITGSICIKHELIIFFCNYIKKKRYHHRLSWRRKNRTKIQKGRKFLRINSLYYSSFMTGHDMLLKTRYWNQTSMNKRHIEGLKKVYICTICMFYQCLCKFIQQKAVIENG